jgi:hypothetical protein
VLTAAWTVSSLAQIIIRKIQLTFFALPGQSWQAVCAMKRKHGIQSNLLGFFDVLYDNPNLGGSVRDQN